MLTNFFCASLTLYLTPDLEQLDFVVFELANRSLDFRHRRFNKSLVVAPIASH
jgi:hypothetical protein